MASCCSSVPGMVGLAQGPTASVLAASASLETQPPLAAGTWGSPVLLTHPWVFLCLTPLATDLLNCEIKILNRTYASKLSQKQLICVPFADSFGWRRKKWLSCVPEAFCKRAIYSRHSLFGPTLLRQSVIPVCLWLSSPLSPPICHRSLHLTLQPPHETWEHLSL